MLRNVSSNLYTPGHFKSNSRGDAIIDSGASKHMASTLKHFRSVVRIPAMKVALANSLAANVTHTELALVDIRSGKLLLAKVYRILALMVNLSSCSRLN